MVFATLLGFVLLSYRLLPSLTVPSHADIHAEYVKFLSGKDTITAYLAYPERPQPAPAVIVIHEIFGLSDFIRQTTEQLAKDGFVAIAPDLLSRRGGTPAAGDSARRLIVALPADSVTADLDATRNYLKTLRSARAEDVGVIGFCWGGGQSFRYATNTPALKAFVVCYGPSPAVEEIPKIRAKGLGVYAENDARINAGLPDAVAALRAAGKDYQYAVYPGVGHGFLRSRDKPEVADSAWNNVVKFFRTQLSR
jgi:carboxymethylenebutenolidase